MEGTNNCGEQPLHSALYAAEMGEMENSCVHFLRLHSGMKK